jgi:DNA-binding transcriptional ArsR family regulator
MDYKPKISLTQDEFRVLASTTRIDIMKLLDESQLTVSDVSRRLSMNKATVHEHLNRLIEVGLVKKEDTNRKWVYYSLTWKGKNLLHPERVKVMVALVTIVIAVVIVGLILAMQSTSVPTPVSPNDQPPLTGTITTNMLWKVMGADDYDQMGYPTKMDMEFRSSSPAIGISSIKRLEFYLENDPSSLTKNRPVTLEYAMEGNTVHLYDRASTLHQHMGEYLMVEITVSDAGNNEYRFLLHRFIVPRDRPIDILISSAGIIIDTRNLSLLHSVSIAFTIENRGTMDIKGANFTVGSVLPSFRGGGYPQYGSPYLNILKEGTVDVPANGSTEVSFNIPAMRLYLRGVVAFLDPGSSVPEQNHANNNATVELPKEIADFNAPAITKSDEKSPGLGPAAVALTVLLAAVAVRRLRNQH